MTKIYLHPLPLRIWHWLNALLVIVLIATGLYLRWHGIAALRPHDPVLVWHKIAGFILVPAAIFWFTYQITLGKLTSRYGICKTDLPALIAQVKFYGVTIFKGAENPFQPSAADKYNPLQKIAYGAVMFILVPVQALTGLLFVDIPPLRQQILSWNLCGLISAIHIFFAYLFVLYLIVHLYMATLGRDVFHPYQGDDRRL